MLQSSSRKGKFCLFGAAVVCTFFSSACLGQSGTPSDVKTYTGLTGAIVEGSAVAVSSLRSSGRTKQFRGMLTEQLLARPIDDTATLRVPMEAVVDFVCGNRESYWKLKSNAEVLRGINASLTDLYKDSEKSGDTTVLGRIISFFRDLYTLVQRKGGTLANPAKKELKDVCKEDLQTFDKVSHPMSTAKIAGVGIAVGIEAVKTTLNVLEPPLRAALQIARNAQRRAAVRKFFRNDQNVQLIKDAAKQLQDIVVAQNDHSRKMSLGGVVEAWAALGQPRKLLDIKGCEEFLKDGNPGGKKAGQVFEYRESFYRCYDAVWAGYEKPFRATLEIAASYDVDADIAVLAKVAEATQSVKVPSKAKGKSPQKGDALSETIASLRSEDEPTEDVVRNIGDFLTLAIAIEKAASKESRDQIKQAIDKALGK